MSDYHQPDFYRFNQDSLLLAQFVMNQMESAGHIIDLGAGCGVLGIELARRLKPKSVTFLEVQSEYGPSLEKNIREFLPSEIPGNILISSFGEFSSEKKWDLIVCNPPYFFPDSGRPSPDSRRNIARSFLIDNWEILLNLISKSLTNEGAAFLVLKKDEVIWKRVMAVIPETLLWEREDAEDVLFLTLSRLDKN